MRIWAGLVLLGVAMGARGQAMPAALKGEWRVEKVVARAPSACWDEARGRELVGSVLRYQVGEMVWARAGSEVRVVVPEVLTRRLSGRKFLEESKVELGAVGIRAGEVMEFDLQHEDADVTGATTEVPGDTVLVAGVNRIVVSACGVYYSAVRAGR